MADAHCNLNNKMANPQSKKDVMAIFNLLSSVITSTSSTVLAVAEETAAEVMVLMEKHEQDHHFNTNKKHQLHHGKIVHEQCYLPQDKHCKFAPQDALRCILWDFLGPNRLHGSKFKLMFVMSRTHFERLATAVLALNQFFKIKRVPSIFLQLYGKLATWSCRLYIYGLLFHVWDAGTAMFFRVCQSYNVQGMFRSIDCMHTIGKNCPKGYHGQYKVKEKTVNYFRGGMQLQFMVLACFVWIPRYIEWYQHSQFISPGQ